MQDVVLDPGAADERPLLQPRLFGDSPVTRAFVGDVERRRVGEEEAEREIGRVRVRREFQPGQRDDGVAGARRQTVADTILDLKDAVVAVAAAALGHVEVAVEDADGAEIVVLDVLLRRLVGAVGGDVGSQLARGVRADRPGAGADGGARSRGAATALESGRIGVAGQVQQLAVRRNGGAGGCRRCRRC